MHSVAKKDGEIPMADRKELVFSFDLQKCLATLHLTAGASFLM